MRVRVGAVHRAPAGSRPQLARMALPDGPAGGVAAGSRVRRAMPIRDVEDEPGSIGCPSTRATSTRSATASRTRSRSSSILSPRLQQIAMLRALGLRHAEISEITGDSPTRVAQLIAQANIGSTSTSRSARSIPARLPRGRRRLWELERDQPRWLTSRIGRRRSRRARRSARARGGAHGAARRSPSTTTALRSVVDASTKPLKFRRPILTRPACTSRPAEPSTTSPTSAAVRSVAGSAIERGPVSRRRASCDDVELPELVPIEYRGELVALVSRDRVHLSRLGCGRCRPATRTPLRRLHVPLLRRSPQRPASRARYERACARSGHGAR